VLVFSPTLAMRNLAFEPLIISPWLYHVTTQPVFFNFEMALFYLTIVHLLNRSLVSEADVRWREWLFLLIKSLLQCHLNSDPEWCFCLYLLFENLISRSRISWFLHFSLDLNLMAEGNWYHWYHWVYTLLTYFHTINHAKPIQSWHPVIVLCRASVIQ
jgi:hypothetical protein